MKYAIQHSEKGDTSRPRRNITWQEQPHPFHCDHEYEVIAHELGAALKRCTKCERQEAE